MANQGRIVASDVDRARLGRLRPRAQRAGVDADLVLVDAPCSGSGTWRRNPETRWRLDPGRLDRLVKVQEQLIDIGIELVRPGGHLVYAVCSVLAAEGREQAEALDRRRSGLISDPPAMEGGRACGPGLLLTPGHDDTDGFFIARWRTAC
jgi:16S rRNA (cytosine967-C5)-methyltransferase